MNQGTTDCPLLSTNIAQPHSAENTLTEVFMMLIQMKPSFLFYTFTLLVCLNSFFLGDTDAQVSDGPAIGSASDNYTFETIDVPGVDFLALTASSDFEDYAGYTRSADDQKMVAFTLIDGVFETYDFPDSNNTYFFALGNDGRAAGTTRIATVSTTGLS